MNHRQKMAVAVTMLAAAVFLFTGGQHVYIHNPGWSYKLSHDERVRQRLYERDTSLLRLEELRAKAARMGIKLHRVASAASGGTTAVVSAPSMTNRLRVTDTSYSVLPDTVIVGEPATSVRTEETDWKGTWADVAGILAVGGAATLLLGTKRAGQEKDKPAGPPA